MPRRSATIVVSEWADDCGVCALANALLLSWREAASKIFPDGHAHKARFNTKTKQIVAALGGKHALQRVKDWHDIPSGSVVKVIPSHCEGTGNWHWVAWRDGKVWCSYMRRAFKPEHYEMRLVSYLAPVERTHVMADGSTHCKRCHLDNPDTRSCKVKGDDCPMRRLFHRSKMARRFRDHKDRHQ